MKFFMFFLALLASLSLGQNARAQKSPSTVRLGIAGISGTNAHPYVEKQLGLFQKHNVEVELIAFQGGSQLIQAMLAGDLPLSLSEGVTALAADLKNDYVFVRF